jgi:hypothetical protein
MFSNVLKKSSISADSIYEFLLHFDEIYRENRYENVI